MCQEDLTPTPENPMSSTDLLALVRSSIAADRIAPELRRLVSSPAGAPDVTGWLHSSILAAIEGEDDEQELIDGLHAIA